MDKLDYMDFAANAARDLLKEASGIVVNKDECLRAIHRLSNENKELEAAAQAQFLKIDELQRQVTELEEENERLTSEVASYHFDPEDI